MASLLAIALRASNPPQSAAVPPITVRRPARTGRAAVSTAPKPSVAKEPAAGGLSVTGSLEADQGATSGMPCGCGLCRRELLGAGLAVGIGGPLMKSNLREKFFVAQMQGMKDYEKKIAPRKIALFRSALEGLTAAAGPGGLSVVEVGVGAGTNFEKLGTATGVRAVTAVEPNEEFVPVAEEAAAKAGMDLKVMNGVMERLPFPDNSVDVVVATLVLCSVTSVKAALKEVRRVLRPGGRYVFTEHVGAPSGTWLRMAQDLANPLQQWFSVNCRLNREPLADIEAEFGATQVHADRFVFGGPDQERSLPQLGEPLPPHFLLSPHISGYAEKSA